jgi:hypothetical protein
MEELATLGSSENPRDTMEEEQGELGRGERHIDPRITRSGRGLGAAW